MSGSRTSGIACCPYCKSEIIITNSSNVSASCEECGTFALNSRTVDEGLAEWNERRSQFGPEGEARMDYFFHWTEYV